MKEALSGIFGRVFTLKEGNALRASASIGLGLLSSAANIGGPLLLVTSIEKLIKDRLITQDVWLNVLYYTMVYSAGRILPVVNQSVLDYLNSNITASISKELHAKCFELPHDEHLTQPTGQLGQLFVKNYSSVERIVPSVLGEIFPTTAEVIAATSLMTARYDWRVGLALLGTVISYIVATAVGKRKLDTTEKELFAISFDAYNKMMSTLSRYEIAHQFDNVDFEKSKAAISINSLRDKYKEKYNKSNVLNATQSMISSASFIGCHMLSLWGVTLGFITVEEFLMVSIYLTQFISPLSKFGNSITQLNNALRDFLPIQDFLSAPSPIQDKVNAVNFIPSDVPPAIKFENVTFGYKVTEVDESGQSVERIKIILNNVSISVRSGQKVAIVGPSEAGKSTLFKLLQRFYLPIDGNILIDDYPLNDLTAKSIRTLLTVVSQKTLLENTTVKDNIQYGDLSASVVEIVLAARAANIASPEEIDEYLQRVCGEDGGVVSGGQKQRISIARSILKGGMLFLLDEATSALDSKTEAAVLETLDAITAGCTTIVITHRLSTILNADLIYYLDHGTIVESGTYEKLMSQHGHFYEQMQKYCQDLGISADIIRPQPRSKEASKLSEWQVNKTRQKLDRMQPANRHLLFQNPPDCHSIQITEDRSMKEATEETHLLG